MSTVFEIGDLEQKNNLKSMETILKSNKKRSADARSPIPHPEISGHLA